MASENEFIKLYRKMLENKVIFKDNDHLALWIHLLLTVNWKEGKGYFGKDLIVLKPGQNIYGRKALSEKINISESKIERILKRFESEQQIEQQTSSKNRLITILNWGSYQNNGQRNEQPVNNQWTTSEQPVDTKEEDKKYKNYKNNNKDLCDSVILYLNEKTGRKFTTSKPNCSHINARAEEGHTLDDFKTVIDNMCAKWLNDSKMSEFLRPNTLFGTKFEGYLNLSVKKGNEAFNGWNGRFNEPIPDYTPEKSEPVDIEALKERLRMK